MNAGFVTTFCMNTVTPALNRITFLNVSSLEFVSEVLNSVKHNGNYMNHLL